MLDITINYRRSWREDPEVGRRVIAERTADMNAPRQAGVGSLLR
jgi:hypothetical protein